MTLGQFNTTQFNTFPINGPSAGTGIPTTLKVIYNQRDIYLNWAPIQLTLLYRVEVSLYPDFRTTFESVWVSASEYSFTDNEPSGQKRFYRVRPSLDGVTYFEPWSEVGSYWLDTALSQELELNRNEFALADPEDMSDFYEFDLFPTYTITKRNLYRSMERNRLGELLSEFLTVKDLVTLNFTGGQFLEAPQMNEILRYYNNVRTVFLATFKDGERQRPMPHVWLVELAQDPSFTMIAAGRPDLLAGTISFEEV